MSTAGELEKLFGAPAPWIMAVLNVTPDSFSDGGKFLDTGAALEEVRRLRESAHIVDIGAESTAPGAKPISAAEEISRLTPILDAVANEIAVSVDTYKAGTARFALERGAKMINDVSALRGDPELGAAVAEHGAFLAMMFAKGSGPLPHANDEESGFKDIVAGVAEFLLKRADAALKAGVAESRIVLDPGMGKFLSNNPDDSWELLARLDELCARVRPFPVLIGASRKGFLGGKLAERDPISQLAAATAVEKGAKLIRTHRPDMAREFFRVQSLMKK